MEYNKEVKSFGNKLKVARVIKNLKQEEVASFLGITRQAVSKWEAGESRPAKPMRRKIEHLLDLEDLYLEDSYNEIEISYTSNVLPILGYATAGLLEEQFEQHLGYVTVPEKYSNQQKYLAVKVNGDSMNRYLPDGAVAVFEKHPAIVNNKIVLVAVNNETTIKKLHDFDSLIMLNPDSTNSNHKPIVIKKENESEIKIYGRLVYFCKEED